MTTATAAALTPYRIRPTDTNRSLPLSCGHKHVTGNTVHIDQASGVAVCGRCVSHE